MLANKVTIIMHIVAYLFIIIVDAIVEFFFFDTLRAKEISAISALVVFFVCTLIFGLIVNTIVTKIVNATPNTITSSLMDLETGSVRG